MLKFDAVVLGAGAAGLHCAAIAGQRGLKVLLLDHAAKLAEKIRISGGGRCNFTNREAGPANFVSANRDFCRSALVRYTPADFIALVDRHRIPWHEKHRGQLFCDDSSERIISMRSCVDTAVQRATGGPVAITIRPRYSARNRTARSLAQLVVANGGLHPESARAIRLRLSLQFGHRIVETPGAGPLTLDAAERNYAWAGRRACRCRSKPRRSRQGALRRGPAVHPRGSADVDLQIRVLANGTRSGRLHAALDLAKALIDARQCATTIGQ